MFNAPDLEEGPWGLGELVHPTLLPERRSRHQQLVASPWSMGERDRVTSGQACCSGGPHSAGGDGTRTGTHQLAGASMELTEVCRAGPKRACADKAPQGDHPPPTPRPGSGPSGDPQPPALSHHRQLQQHSRSSLDSRCRLHGRPHGVTQGLTNSTVSMQSGERRGSARTCVWPRV